MTAAWLQMDDDGWRILGNALLLGWMAGPALRDRIRRQFGPEEMSAETLRAERREAGERTELRDCLLHAGALDPLFGRAEVEPLGALFGRILTRLDSSEDPLATLHLGALASDALELRAPGFMAALAAAPAFEAREPLARLGATEVTRHLRRAVLAYFRNPISALDVLSVGHSPAAPMGAPQTEAGPAASKGGPRKGPAAARERRATAALVEWARRNPDMRPLRGAMVSALEARGITKKGGRDRVWRDAVASPEAAWWRESGNPSTKEVVGAEAVLAEFDRAEGRQGAGSDLGCEPPALTPEALAVLREEEARWFADLGCDPPGVERQAVAGGAPVEPALDALTPVPTHPGPAAPLPSSRKPQASPGIVVPGHPSAPRPTPRTRLP